MRKTLGPAPRRLTERTMEEVCIDYQRLVTAPAARWLQNDNENISVSYLSS